MNQSKLAKKCGMSRKHLSAIKLGQRRPSVTLARRLAAECGTDILFWLEADPKKFRKVIETAIKNKAGDN